MSPTRTLLAGAAIAVLMFAVFIFFTGMACFLGLVHDEHVPVGPRAMPYSSGRRLT